MIVGVIRRKPVLTHASIVCEGMLASVNSVNVYEVQRDSSKLTFIRCAVLSLHSAMCSLRAEPTYTPATYETTAVSHLHFHSSRKGHRPS